MEKLLDYPFNRIVHQRIAERPRSEEEMTTQIAEALKKYAKTDNIAVPVKAEHHCMTHRGVKEHHRHERSNYARGI